MHEEISHPAEKLLTEGRFIWAQVQDTKRLYFAV